MAKSWFRDKSDGQVFWVDPAKETEYLDKKDASGEFQYDTDVTDAEIADYERQDAEEQAVNEPSTRVAGEKAAAPVVANVTKMPAAMRPEADQFGIGGFSGAAMAAAEGFVDGALFNFPVGVLGQIDPQYAERARLRKELHPTTEKVAEYAGMFLPSAGTLLKGSAKVAAKAPKLYKAASAASELDVTSKLFSKLGSTRLLRPSEEALTTAREAFVTPEMAARAEYLERAFGKEARLAYESEIAANTIDAVLTDRYAKMPLAKGAKEALRVAAAMGGAAAVEGAIRGAGTELREQAETNPDLAAADLTKEVLKSALEGGVSSGVVGGGLGLATPYLAKGLGKAIEGTNNVVQWTLGKAEEILGSRITDLKPQDIKLAREALRKAVKEGAGSTSTDLSRQLNKETNDFLASLGFLNDAIERKGLKGLTTAGMGHVQGIVKDGLDLVEALKKSPYAFKAKDGKTYLDANKIAEAITIDDSGNLVFPEVIRNLREASQGYAAALEVAERSFAEHSDIAKDPELSKVFIARIYEEMKGKTGKTAEQIAEELAGLKQTESDVGKFLAPVTQGRKVDVGFGSGIVPPLLGLAAEAGGIKGGALVAGASALGTALVDPVAVLKTLNVVDRASISVAQKLSDFGDRVIFGAGRQIGAKAGAAAKGATTTRSDYGSALKQYETTKANLDKYNNPDALADLLEENYGGLRDTSPAMSDQAARTTAGAIAFLQSKLPKQEGTRILLKGWKPSQQQIEKFNRYTRYVNDPETILTDIEEKGFVSPEALEVMTQVYPEWHQELKTTMVDKLADAERAGTIDSRKRYLVDKIFGAKTEGVSSAALKQMQDAMALPQMKPPAPRRTTAREQERNRLPSEQ